MLLRVPGILAGGGTRDQAQGAELTPRDPGPGCRHRAVVFESSGRSLLSSQLNSAVTSEADTRRKVLFSFEFIWSLDQHSYLGNSQCVKMGCAHASKILTNDDIEFIAKNTALSKDQVEVFK